MENSYTSSSSGGPVRRLFRREARQDNAAPDAGRVAHMAEVLSRPIQALLAAAASLEKEGGTSPAPIQDAQALLAASPIAPLLGDDSVTDILINGPHAIFAGRNGKVEKTGLQFSDSAALQALAEAVASSAGRRIDPRKPLVDTRLKDGSRVNIIAPPLAVDGISMSIRKFPKQGITLDKLVELGTLTQEMADFLKLCAQCRVSLLVSGGTGTGKTTMLNAISQYIPDDERIVTIEDTVELRLNQADVVRLEMRPPSQGEEGSGVSATDLVKNALRMRPDRIVVGEVRGDEAYDMIQAMNTGHDGSMSSIHANSPRDAITRLENLISSVMQNAPALSVRRQIVSALQMIIQIAYTPEGKRVVTSITDVIGLEGEVPTTQEIFRMREEIVGNPPKVVMTPEWTGIPPRHHKLAEMTKAQGLFPSMPPSAVA